ncbi:unnamed protein product [Zymoseptoria tritici ST99CH_1A5]|uniref:C2H2-type domain-containing protein n=1 Tax=Zymoseptoria tritici ST99CH_1A5 TaxID=1276529 RepID=A0A1Y6LBC2_ZYMTR|nr:unnamed protein product [Zymoseptoria tritici ST99CH_3D1]SMY21777.1 unnamed protein product [Zymoseptoria tritici ST99CH_1A5]
MPDASGSGSSSICSYSQPATPVQSMRQSHESYVHHWSDHPDGQGMITSSIPEGCAMDALAPQMFNGSFSHPLSGVESGPRTSSASVSDAYAMPILQSPMNDAWSTQQAPMALNMSINMGFGRDTVSSSMYANPPSAMHTGLEPSPFQNFASPPTSIYASQQIVVPSQINPQDDYQMDDYPGYPGGPEDTTDVYQGSFNSSQASFNNGWVDVRHPSPDASYFCQEDDSDFISVKHETSTPPTRMLSSTIRSRRTSRKPTRNNKSATASRAWHTHETHGFRFEYKGVEWTSNGYDAHGKLHVAPAAQNTAPINVCDFVDPVSSKACSRKFQRAEHLKRHAKMHTDVREFWCPVPNCKTAKKGGIGRSDNASDHFKTHLRAAKSGKRNLHCTFEYLETRILESYDDQKKAEKVLAKLRAWYPGHVQQEREEQEREKREGRVTTKKGRRC